MTNLIEHKDLFNGHMPSEEALFPGSKIFLGIVFQLEFVDLNQNVPR